MDGDKLIRMQMQVKQNSEEMVNYINDLNTWENEIKSKDESLKHENQPLKRLPPVRSRIKKTKKTVQSNKISESNAKRIKSWDYKSWEKFDADKECEKVDESSSSEEEESEGEVELRVNTLREQGNDLFKQGKHSHAIGLYTQALCFDPCNSILFCNRAMAYLKLDRYQLAENDCSKAIEYDPENVKAYMRRGMARQSLKKQAEAEQDFKEVLKLEPKNKFCSERLQEVSMILDSQNQKIINKTSSKLATDKSIVMPIMKHPKDRSKKPLKRIAIEEIGLDPMPVANENANYDLSFQKFLDKKSDGQNLEKYRTSREERKLDDGLAAQSSVNNNVPHDENALLNKNAPPLNPPSNSYQFQVDWNMLREKDFEFFQYLKTIKPSSYKQTFGEAFDSDILSKIISVIHQYHDKSDAYLMLRHLADVKRFSMNVGFLSSTDKQKLEQIFEILRKNRPEGDVELLKSLYK